VQHISPVHTTCPYCGVGCGIIAQQTGDAVTVKGDSAHPANGGRLCSKGSALGETVDLQDRLLYPEMGGQRVSWETAMDSVADGFNRVITQHGPQAVAFYVSGQLLTEDYYVANKLMKGFIGASNIDTNSRLCMASSVVGHQRAFGSDTVPGNYEDLEEADLVVLVGTNLAWCHPVLYQRLAHAKGANPHLKVIVIDPRRTATCDIADLHLNVAPGSDTVLFNGLLVYLHQHYPIAWETLENRTTGYQETLDSARQVAPDMATVAHCCGVAEAELRAFYWSFCATEKSVTVYSQGVNQSSYGSDKVNAIINCHLLTNRVGKPGQGPFSVTGQPNAMGGREVGGLANQLAAHMNFTPEDLDRVGRFWHPPLLDDGLTSTQSNNRPRITQGPGLKAVDLFDAIGDGTIKAVWIMATNPLVSLPNADAVKAALQRCDLVVISDVVDNTDTATLAHIRLPALAWGEKDGTVTNSERCISRQRGFLPAPGETRPDWWIISQVANRMGYGSAFDYAGPASIFREHAALSGFENHASRSFDISALATLSDNEYDALEPVRWPVPLGRRSGTARLLGDGRFYHASGQARFVAIGARRPAYSPDSNYPLVLNTGRVRDHWHTMTRTGKSPRLADHTPEPYGEIHPQDAAKQGISDGALMAITSRWGNAIVRVQISEQQRPGSVFVAMHWCAPYAQHGRINTLVNPAVDPFSGQPESKHTPVQVTPYKPTWHGFILTRQPLDSAVLATCSYWVRVRGQACWRYEMAGDTTPADWRDWTESMMGEKQILEWLEYRDAAVGRYRCAGVDRSKLQFCLFVGPSKELPPRRWLSNLFADDLDDDQRRSLLSGGPSSGHKDSGHTVCACFSVGLNTLVAAISKQGLITTEALGGALKAGTNCGSCIPELQTIIRQVNAAGAA
jgi:assimilatory nitrate reductase catalytic subunit